jgi:protein deglycase
LAIRQAEIFYGARVTCYPSLEGQLIRGNYFVHDTSADTIIDGRLITSRGPATAIDFALNIVKILKGESVRQMVADGLLVN